MSIRERCALEITERKKEIVSLLGDVAVLGSERMVQTIGKARLRDAAIGTGVAVDKMLALTGQTPVAVGVVVMPSEHDREERRQLDHKLDAIARSLNADSISLCKVRHQTSARNFERRFKSVCNRALGSSPAHRQRMKASVTNFAAPS
jgi:hypothetical protein